MNVHPIDLPEGLLGSRITVCLLQLKSPFYDEASIIRRKEYQYIGWFAEPCDRRREKIKRLLEALSKFKRHIDLLVFPEYSLPVGIIEDIRKFSFENSTIVIANYYDDEQRRSVSPVFMPSGEIHYTYKSKRSPYDINVLAESSHEAETFRFYWKDTSSIDNTKSCFQVFTCLDFLEYARDYFDREAASILIVPMCSPEINQFVHEANRIMRLRDPEEKTYRNAVSLLCNASDISSRKGIGICGQSQIVGAYKDKTELPIVESGCEGGIVATVIPSNVIHTPTPLGKENVVIESPIKFFIERDGEIRIESSLATTRNIIAHPHLFQLLGLKRYHGFFRMKDYYTHRNSLQRIGIGCDAVYGRHDLVISSFEESEMFSQLRLHSCLGPESVRALIAEDFVETTEVYKCRGYKFAELENNRFKPTPLDPSVTEDFINHRKSKIRDMLIGKDKDQSFFIQLKKLGVFVEGYALSDLTDEMRKEGYGEFLLLVFIYATPTGKNPHQLFDKEVVTKLIERRKGQNNRAMSNDKLRRCSRPSIYTSHSWYF